MTIPDFLTARRAEIYDEPRTPGHDTITAQMAAEVAKHLKPGASILDVGCGQGAALEWFRDHGFRPVGISANAAEVAVLRQRGFSAYVRDMHYLIPFYTDCIWARHVLEHSPVPFYLLTEFRERLYRGGILYVEVPAPDTACHHEANPNHYSILGLEMWKSLIVRAGFTLLEIRRIDLATAAGPDTYFSLLSAFDNDQN